MIAKKKIQTFSVVLMRKRGEKLNKVQSYVNSDTAKNYTASTSVHETIINIMFNNHIHYVQSTTVLTFSFLAGTSYTKHSVCTLF